jgi:hypothetical protein
MGRVATDNPPCSFCGGEMKSRKERAAYMRAWSAANPDKAQWNAHRSYIKNRKKRLAQIRRRYKTDPVYREAMRLRAKAWRKAHPEWKRRADSGRRFQAKQFVRKYLETHPCIDCGESDPVVLHFHHRNPKKKRYTIGAGWASGILPKSLIKEIRKCDVLCANCHARRHFS